MVKFGDSDRAYSCLHTPTLVSSMTDRCVLVFFFFFFNLIPLPPPPPSPLHLFLSMKREIKSKMSTNSLCFGPLSFGWPKESIRELVKIVTIAEVDQENFGQARLKGFTCVGTFVMGWSSTKNHQILLDFSEVGAEEEQEKHSHCSPKKVDWAAKKWIFDRREEHFRWVVVQSGTSEKKLTKNKK